MVELVIFITGIFSLHIWNWFLVPSIAMQMPKKGIATSAMNEQKYPQQVLIAPILKFFIIITL